MWKSQNVHASSGGTQEDEIENTKFEIRKAEKQVGMTEKSDPPFQKPKPKGQATPEKTKSKSSYCVKGRPPAPATLYDRSRN